MNTTGFEIRVNMFVPASITGQVKKGDDLTPLLLNTRFLSGYAPEEVQAIVMGGGPKRTQVAFLWEDAGDAEMWYIEQKVEGGMNPELAMDRFYEVAINLA